jgi:hypothetical protein
LGYIPSGCPLTVSISAEESQPSWFQDAPEIRGSVTLSNPSTYNVPIANIIVQARSSDGMQYSVQAYCDGNASPTVPFNPQPYQYGTLTCRYRLVLDRNVFGRYGQSNNRKLLGNGQVQANFFPGSSSGGGGSSGSGYNYFPSPSQRASWTVTAIVTVRYSNAQCLSGPTPVNTDCWWNWLASWHQQHQHKFSWLLGGRKLLMSLVAGSDAHQEAKQAGSNTAFSRSLLHSESDSSSSEHRRYGHFWGWWHRHGSSASRDSGRSLLHVQVKSDDSGNSGFKHRGYGHYWSWHHRQSSNSLPLSDSTDSSGSGAGGRSLLHSESGHSDSYGPDHRGYGHWWWWHPSHSSSGSYSDSRDSRRSLLHSE